MRVPCTVRRNASWSFQAGEKRETNYSVVLGMRQDLTKTFFKQRDVILLESCFRAVSYLQHLKKALSGQRIRARQAGPSNATPLRENASKVLTSRLRIQNVLIMALSTAVTSGSPAPEFLV